MRRPLAILLTLLLAAACLPLVVFAAPAEAEAPEVPDEVKGVHVLHLMVTMEDDPETTFPLDLTIYPEQEGAESEAPDAYYILDCTADELQLAEDEAPNIAYLSDVNGQTWIVDLNDENLQLRGPVAEAPDAYYILDEEAEDRFYTITVQPDPDGPEGTYAIALLPYQGDTVPYDVVEPQAEEDAYCYLLLDSGETVMILNDDTLDPQSLPDSAPGVHFTSEHLHKCKKASLYKTLSDSDDPGVAYDLWQYRCAVPGCDYIMEDYLATLSPMS